MAGTFVKNMGGLNLGTEDKDSKKTDLKEEKTAGSEINLQNDDQGLLVNENIQCGNVA